MELLCDVGHVESHLFLFGDSISVGAKIGARFPPNVPLAQKLFWPYLMVLLDDEAQVKARFNSFGDRGNLDSR
jgi:hypothetical protein